MTTVPTATTPPATTPATATPTATTPAPAPVVTTVTERTLRRLRGWLSVVAVLAVVAPAVLLYGAGRTAATIAGGARAAVVDVAEARQAIVDADGEAVSAFGRRRDPLGGPGDQYVGEISLAGQSLELAAGANEGGIRGTQTLQLVSSMISTYTSMVDNASVAYAAGNDRLGLAELWDASNFVHTTGGILRTINDLDDTESAGMHALATTFWTAPVAVPIWTAPAGALLVLLVITQLYLARRFRRTVNPPLAMATLLTFAAVAIGPLLALRADHDLAGSLTELDTVRGDLRIEAVSADWPRQIDLSGMVIGYCGDACGSTLGNLTSGSYEAIRAAEDTALADRAAGEQAAAADVDLGLATGLAIGALASGALVFIGLWPRISEYRYRP